MSRIIRKPAFCIFVNKDADQLCDTAQPISASVFLHRYHNSSTSEIQDFKQIAIFCGCIAQFVLDLLGNSQDRFCGDAAHIIVK